MKMKIAIGCFLLAVLGLNSPQAFRIAFRTGTPDVAAGGGLDKTSLIAWYDFATNTDAHASYDLTNATTNAFTYTAGTPDYGSAEDDPDSYVENADLDDNWMETDTNSTHVVRWRMRTTSVGNGYVFYNDNAIDYIRRTFITDDYYIRTRIGAVVSATTVVPATNVWYLTIIQFDASDDGNTTWVNDVMTAEVTGTFSDSSGATRFGGTSAVGGDFDFDYAAFYSRALTADERTWLYNSGGTRTYSELSD